MKQITAKACAFVTLSKRLFDATTEKKPFNFSNSIYNAPGHVILLERQRNTPVTRVRNQYHPLGGDGFALRERKITKGGYHRSKSKECNAIAFTGDRFSNQGFGSRTTRTLSHHVTYLVTNRMLILR